MTAFVEWRQSVIRDKMTFCDVKRMDGTTTLVRVWFRTTMSTNNPNVAKVRVCVRCRPLNRREALLEKGKKCISYHRDKTKLVVAESRDFTFDHVYDESSNQKDIFDDCIQNLIDGCFQGYNATVLACRFRIMNANTRGLVWHNCIVVHRWPNRKWKDVYNGKQLLSAP